MITFKFNAVPEAVGYRVYIKDGAFGVASVDSAGNRSARDITYFEGEGDSPMPIIKDVTIKITSGNPGDVHDCRLYIELAPTSPMRALTDWASLGNEFVDGLLTKNLNDLPNFTTLDGIYNMGISFVDAVGNESSLLRVNDVALDFIAPDSPLSVTVERT